MSKLDLKRNFVPIKIALLTISDTRNFHTDKSGDLLAFKINEAGHNLVKREITQDDTNKIIEKLTESIKDQAIDVVISTGGTGLTGKDVTPEAFRSVFDKEIEGFGVLRIEPEARKVRLQIRDGANNTGSEKTVAIPKD